MAQRVTLAVPDPANPGQDMNVGTSASPLAVTGGGGSSANPGIAGGEYNSTPPALTNGQTDALQLDQRGHLQTTLYLADNVNSVGATTTPADGAANASINALRSVTYGLNFNGTTWDRLKKPNSVSRLISAAASTNATSVKSTAGDVFQISGFNANAAARYLKLYNLAVAPTVGTSTPVWTEYLAPQAKFTVSLPTPMYFGTGIAYALTTGSADADTGALTAGDILAMNIAYA